jgi:hypothetical protein
MESRRPITSSFSSGLSARSDESGTELDRGGRRFDFPSDGSLASKPARRVPSLVAIEGGPPSDHPWPVRRSFRQFQYRLVQPRV